MESSTHDDAQRSETTDDLIMGTPRSGVAVLYVEATGTGADDEAIAIAIADADGRIVFDRRVRPTRHQNWPASSITGGIAWEDVKDEPTLAGYADRLHTLLNGKLVVGCGLERDLAVLAASGFEVHPQRTFDISARAQGASPAAATDRWATLCALASSYGCQPSSHTAREGALAEARCLAGIVRDSRSAAPVTPVTAAQPQAAPTPSSQSVQQTPVSQPTQQLAQPPMQPAQPTQAMPSAAPRTVNQPVSSTQQKGSKDKEPVSGLTMAGFWLAVFAAVLLAGAMVLHGFLLLIVALVVGIVALVLTCVGIHKRRAGVLGGFGLACSVFVVAASLGLGALAFTHYGNSSSSTLDSYRGVTYEQLSTSTRSGQQVEISGDVMGVSQNDDGSRALLLAMDGDTSNQVLVTFDDANGVNPVEGQRVIIYGTTDGTQQYRGVSGVLQEAPAVEADRIVTSGGRVA